jgi:hypothetical protein
VQPDALSARVAYLHNLRHQIEQDGEAIVGEMELLAFSWDTSGHGQWDFIAQIAIQESWSFTFFPNGDVRFAKLDVLKPA